MKTTAITEASNKNDGLKTPAQIEFSELFEALRKNGWNQAALARELKYSQQAAVGMILKGKTGVSELRLQRMRELVAGAAKSRGPASAPLAGFAAPPAALADARIVMAGEQLEYLRTHDPEGYHAAALTIRVLHERAVKGVSTDVANAAIASQAAAYAASTKVSYAAVRKTKASGKKTVR